MTSFQSDNSPLTAAFERAVTALQRNIVPLPVPPGVHPPEKVLTEGGGYPGIWQECGPVEGLVYGRYFDPKIAIANHDMLFVCQLANGQIPSCIRGNNTIGLEQIQMVDPIARTAWESYQLTGDIDFLARAYEACSRWDVWLTRHRDRQGLGLVELFCEYDTGHDNSRRLKDFGIPKRCPEVASNSPDIPTLPWLAPDLSATLYGGRRALAAMARELGRTDEAATWERCAERTKAAIMKHLYDPETECFYDVQNDGKFNVIVTDAVCRVLAEGVVDEEVFAKISERHIFNEKGLWTPYPMASAAVSDPRFSAELPPNCWSGPTQALAALRAPHWMEHYGRHAELGHLMAKWIEALVRAPFLGQQLNPFTGDIISNPWVGEDPQARQYTPSALALVDFLGRICGAWSQGGEIHWRCGLPDGATTAEFRNQGFGREFVVKNTSEGAVFILGQEPIAKAQGRCLVVTNSRGQLKRVTNTAATPQTISIFTPQGSEVFRRELAANTSAAIG